MRYELPAVGSIARSYNALLDRAAERDDLEALVLLHQDAEIVDADLCAKVRAALQRPRRRGRRLRRRARRPQHRLVGGVGDARLLHQPLRGSRRRRPALVLVDLGGRAAVGADGRGGDAGRLRARAGAVGRAQHPLRRVAQPLPRLRPRLLPPGPRGRPEGGHRGLPRHPPPRDRDAPGPGGVDRGPHQRRREVGRPDAAASAPRRAAGASGRCAPRPSATPPRRMAHTQVLELEARARELERGLAETRESLSWRLSAPLRWSGGRARRRPAGRASRASPDDRVRLRPSPTPRPTGASPSPASGARPSRTPRSTRSRRSATSCRGYNLLLDVAAGHDDLEALVIVDPRTEIADPGFCARVREALRDPDVAVAGPVGARDVSTIAWWEGEVSCAPIVHRYYEHGGGEMAGYALGASLRAARRGRLGRRLPARAVAVGRADPPLRRVARHGPRLRPRLLPPGPRGRPQGGHRGPARDPPPRARAAGGPRRVGRGAHQARRQVGRPLAGPQRRAGGLEGPRPPRRGRARGGADDGLLEHAAGRRGGPGARARAGRDDGEPVVARHRAAAAAEPPAPRDSTS